MSTYPMEGTSSGKPITSPVPTVTEVDNEDEADALEEATVDPDSEDEALTEGDVLADGEDELESVSDAAVEPDGV